MYKVLHFSDLHYSTKSRNNGKIDSKTDIGIHSTQEEEFIDILDKYIEKEKVDLFVISGDIIKGGDEEGQKDFSQKFMELLKTKGYDNSNVLVVPGNHDVKKGSPESSEERYKSFFDSWKNNAHLPYLDGIHKTCNIHIDTSSRLMFIPVNTSNWSQRRIKASSNIENHLKSLDEELKKEFDNLFTYDAAYISKEQLRELESKIERIEDYKSYTKILIQHHHLVSVDNSIELKAMSDILNIEDIKNFIKKYNIRVLLHGHKHVEKAFFEYLNKDGEPYKLLLSSAPNVKKETFFQILEFNNLNVKISNFDRNGEPRDSNTFSVYNTIETENTIILEDNDITNLYNKVIDATSNEKNKNKQLICNFKLENYQDKKYPILNKYPDDSTKQMRYKKEIEKHVDWWQQDRTIYDDINELHGPRLKKYNGYINQLDYISKKLEQNSNTSKTVAILIEPTKDFYYDKNYPSFISCQFIVREQNHKKYLDILANFRKQETRYWWPLNIAELHKLLYEMKNKLGQGIYLGKIITITNIFTLAEENAFGRSYVSSIDYYLDIDPANLMHQAHSIMCNKMSFKTKEELDKSEFVQLLDEIINDFQEFVKVKNNEDGNAKPRIGILKLAEFIKKAKDNSCEKQNKFHKSLEKLGEIAETSNFDDKFIKSLDIFSKALDEVIHSYQELKESLIK